MSGVNPLARRNESHLATALLCSILFFLNAAGVAALKGAQAGVNVHAFPPGARAYGMGGAFVAVADDASALYWNPAGLVDSRFSLLGSVGVQEFGKLEEMQAVFDAVDTWDGEEDQIKEGSLDQRLSLSALAALSVGPVGLGTLGEGWMDVDVREERVRAVNAEDDLYVHDGEPLLDETFPAGTLDSSLLIGARAGLGLRVLNLGAGGSLALGVAGTSYVSGMRLGYELDPEEKITVPSSDDGAPQVPEEGLKVFEARERVFEKVNGYAIDLGLKARLTPWITVGAVAHDVVHTLTWKGEETTTTGKLKEVTPSKYHVDEEQHRSPVTATVDRSMRYQVGVAVTPPLLGLTLAADLDSEQVVHLGAEWRTLFGILALRAGYLTPLGGDELPSWYGAPVRVGVGLGLPFLHLNAGAGFKSMDELSTVQDAMVELSLRF